MRSIEPYVGRCGAPGEQGCFQSWRRWRPLLAALLVLFAQSAGAPPAVPAQETSSPEAAEAYAKAARAQKNNAYDLAADEWTKFLKDYPKDSLAPRASYYLGVCRLQLKQFAPAATAFRQLLDAAPQHELAEDARLNLGWCLYTLGKDNEPQRLAEAAKRFDELLEKHPDGKYSDQALFFGAECRYAAGEIDQAIPLYRRLLKEHADSRFAADGAYALGVALEEAKRYDEAQAVYDSFLAKHAESELANEVRMRKAETQLQLGQVQQAAAAFTQLAATPGFALADYALMRHAACLLKEDKDGEAAARYAELPEKFPRSAYIKEAVAAAGRGFFRAKQDDQAEKWLGRAWETDQDLDAAHWLIRTRLRSGKLADAEQVAQTALPLADGDEHARLQLDLADTLYASPDKRRDAYAMYRQAYDQHPDSPSAAQALYNAAFGALELGELDAAAQLADQFGKKFNTHELSLDALYVAAESRLQLRKHEEAAALFQELLAQAEGRAERGLWTLRRGWALYLPGQQQATIDFLSQAAASLASQAEQAEAYFLIGSSRFAQEDFAGAGKDLQRSVDLDAQWPRASEALLLLSRCLQKQGKLTEALAAAQRVARDYADSAALDQAYYRQGEYLYALGNYAEAAEAYEASLKAGEKSAFAPFALHGQAWSFLKSERYADAVAALDRFESQYADHELAAESLFARAMANRQSGKFEAALADADAFLQSSPAPERRADAAYEKGLAQAALKQFDAAEQTFAELLKTKADYVGADKVLYEWAWALKSQQKDAEAAEKFTELAKQYGQSPLASEAWYHVGQQQYDAKNFADAAAAYQTALDSASNAGLREKSLYKLGWSRFELQQYSDAKKAFSEQAGLGDALPLYADARFMEAEAVFRAKQYAEALELFKKLRADKVQPPAEAAQVLLLLHGAQAAGQVKDWETSAQWLRDIESRHPESAYLPEAKVELGWALQNLQRGEEALQLYADSGARGVLAARADFLSGEVHFAAKRFAEAIKSFRRVMFLYDAEAVAGVEPWQAQAGFEAGRCAEVQIQNAADEAERQQHVEAARTFYRYVVEKHGQTQFAKSAQMRLKTLEQL